tara:strand:+ start:327 stop:587 length:261 start_codon:yes stop_codon:yes gene_type:complete
LGGRSFTSSNKHIRNKVGNISVSKEKSTTWQQSQETFPDGTFKHAKAQSQPFLFPSNPLHHQPSSKHAITLSSVALRFTIFSLVFK